MTTWTESGFYKAFIPGKNAKGKEKEPIQAYTKEENHQTWEQCQSQNNILGILADDAVLLDPDEEIHSNNLMEIIQGENLQCMTSTREGGRGIHALFLNSGINTGATAVMLACGVVVDIKLGCRNGLDCLKYQGVERVQSFNEPPYQAIPKYLLPLKNCKINFASMGEGDGRNDTLYSYILTLQGNDFSIEEIKQCVTIINKYVLKEPVSDNELEVILRDEAFKKQSFYKGHTFLHDRFAEHIKRTHHVKKINGQLHVFKDGVYIPGYEAIEKAMIAEISSLTDAKRKEVLKYLTVTCEQCSPSGVNLIAFRNGIYDLYTDTLIPFSPDVVITNKIPWDYNANAYDELADKTLNKIACDDPDIRALIEEMIGSCFYRSNTLGGGKAFILTGDGANGKSTLIKTLKVALHTDNISSLDLKELSEKFQNAELFGKLANLGDDIEGEYIPNVASFRKLVTGEQIQVQRKGEKPFEFANYAKMIFSANRIPRLGTSRESYSIMRRLVIIPFNAKFTSDDPDYNPEITWELQKQESVEYLILLGIRALKKVIKDKQFTKSTKVQNEMDDYEQENNPVAAFVEEVGVDSIENEPTSDIYRQYTVFCTENGFREMSKTSFTRQLKVSAGLESVHITRKGKSIRIYSKIE